MADSDPYAVATNLSPEQSKALLDIGSTDEDAADPSIEITFINELIDLGILYIPAPKQIDMTDFGEQVHAVLIGEDPNDLD